jgi:putative PIN family toxin of toxin-antitoxin system
MRLVIDTSVLVAAVRSDRGAARRLLVAVLEGRCQLVVTATLLMEYEAVLKRDEHRAASGASIDDLDALLDALAKVAEPVRINYAWRPLLDDPDDELVLEAAVNGRARLIASFDLRDLGPAARFGIEVVRPGEVLRRLREQMS